VAGRVPRGALIVSHDRTFLDETENRIVALDGQSIPRAFRGRVQRYAAAVRSRDGPPWAQWRDQQVEIRAPAIRRTVTMARAVRKENATKDSTQRRYARKVALARQSQRNALAPLSRLRGARDSRARRGRSSSTSAICRRPGRMSVYAKTWRSAMTPRRALLRDLTSDAARRGACRRAGAERHGKSTLLKTIIGALPPLAGRVRLGSSVRVGYLAQEQEILDPASNALAVIQAESPLNHTDARSFLHYFLFSGDDVFTPARDLSYGERARLMLAVLVARGANLLVLDEPINHLDVPSREQFEQALAAFQGSVLAVVHDRYFVDRFATTVWRFEVGALTEQSARRCWSDGRGAGTIVLSANRRVCHAKHQDSSSRSADGYVEYPLGLMGRGCRRGRNLRAGAADVTIAIRSYRVVRG